MNDIAKLLIAAGFFLLLAGIVLILLGRIPGVGRLPGDIIIKKENFSFYFPLATCILLSLILTIVLNLWSRK